jgi:hypothetical protein
MCMLHCYKLNLKFGHNRNMKYNLNLMFHKVLLKIKIYKNTLSFPHILCLSDVSSCFIIIFLNYLRETYYYNKFTVNFCKLTYYMMIHSNSDCYHKHIVMLCMLDIDMHCIGYLNCMMNCNSLMML